MQRREFLRLLAFSLPALELDLDKLLWVPGEKKIFLPSTFNLSDIVAEEIARITPYLRGLFEVDEAFYKAMRKEHLEVIGPEIKFPIYKKVI